MEALGLGLTALATAIESICVSALFLGSGVIVIIGLLLFTKVLTLKDIADFIKELKGGYRR
jgi:hypothetical protein